MKLPENAQIAESGIHDELLVNKALYFDMYEQQQMEEEVVEN